MRFNQGFGPALAVVGLGLFILLTFSAWMHIQALRLSYRAQSLRLEMAVLERREEGIQRRFEFVVSLPRLDQSARGRFGLRLSHPDQLRFLFDT